MKRQPRNDLTQELVLELFDYDYENGWLIRKKDNHGRIVNRPCGHKPINKGYGQVNIDGKMYLAHRIIWLWHYGEWPEHEIDHKDQNPMNNRIENLRHATRYENNQNRRMNRNNTSGFPGVYWNKQKKKWRARITVDCKEIHLGYFNTAEEAYRAYQLAKIGYHPSSLITKQYRQELGIAA